MIRFIRAFCAALALCFAVSAEAQTTGVRIPNLPAAGALTGTETVPCVQGGVTVLCPLFGSQTFASGLKILIPALAPSSATGPSSGGIYANETIVGTGCTTGCFYNSLFISDSTAIPNLGTGWGFYLEDDVGGATMTGDRSAANISLHFNATSSNTGAQSYSALVTGGSAIAGDGGTGTSLATSKGQLETMNVIAYLGPLATYWNVVQGVEYDLQLEPGSSTSEKTGVQISQLTTQETITGGSISGTTVTLNFASNGFGVGTAINVAGATPSAVNGNFLVTASTATSISYVCAACSTGAVTGAATVTTGDTTAGSVYDDAIDINAGYGAAGWNYALALGGNLGHWPMQTTGTVIGCPDGCGTLGTVLEFSSATIASYFLHGPGFSVDGAGNETALTVSTTGSSCVSGQTGIYHPVSGAVAFCAGGISATLTGATQFIVGGTSVLNAGDGLSVVGAQNGDRTMTIENASTGSSNRTIIDLGNDASLTEGQIILNGNTNTSGFGANSLQIKVGGVNALASTASGAVTIGAGSSNVMTVNGSVQPTVAALETAAAPTLSSCGTSPAAAAGSGNAGGAVTVGTGTVTACTVAYATAYPNYAFPTISWASAPGSTTVYVSASSKTGFTVTFSVSSPGAKFTYAVAGD